MSDYLTQLEHLRDTCPDAVAQALIAQACALLAAQEAANN